MFVEVVLSAVALLLFYILLVQKSFWARLGIPEDPGFPLVGCLLPVILGRKSYHEVTSEIYFKYAKLKYVGVYQMNSPSLLVRDPQLMETMLKQDAKIFDDPGMVPDPSDPLSLNLFNVKGQLWKWIRGKLSHVFATSRINGMFSGIQEYMETYSQSLSGTKQLRSVTDEYTIEIIARIVFGVDNSTGFMENTRCVFCTKGLQGLRMGARFFLPGLVPLLGIRFAPKEVEKFFRNALRKSHRRPGGFLDHMIKLQEEDPEFTEDLIAAQFFLFALAGFETTSTTLMFCLYHLAKYPEVQRKTKEEIEKVLQDKSISFEAIKDMVYLDAVVNETLRLYPPVTGIRRLANAPYQLPCGAVIPPGTSVGFSFWGQHRDPEYFPEPDLFKPERFLNETIPQKFFHPFGIGPRICIGMKLAVMEIKTFLVNALINYELRLNAKTVEPFEYETSTYFVDLKKPLWCDFVPINK